MSKTMRFLVAIFVAVVLVAVLLMLVRRKDKATLTVGAIVPLTGDAASYGVAIRQGIELAARKVNDEKGIEGRTIEVLCEDSKADPKEGVAAAKKLIAVNRVQAIIGAVASSVTLAVAPVAERSGVVLLSPASSSPRITTQGDYIFRNYPSDELEGRLVAKFAMENGYGTAALLTINNDYGNGLKLIFTKTFTGAGGSIVLNDKFEQGTTDFRAVLTKVKQASPNCIFIVGYSKELGTLVKQARELGIKDQFLSTVNFYDSESIATGGTAVEGLIFSSPVFDALSEETHVREFVNAFKKRFGKDPDVWSAHGYDAMLLLAKAMRDKGTDADSIREGLNSISGFPGVSGTTTFDENGDVVKSARFLTVRNGQFVPYK